MDESKSASRTFTNEEVEILEEIILNRRDVRGNRFLNKPIDNDLVEKIIWAGLNAPSVGFSQPWEFVLIKNQVTKLEIYNSFLKENKKASTQFGNEKSAFYNSIKLEGIKEAPLNIAVFYQPHEGAVLGQTSMPETGPYSVVCAIQNMWLMARALNIGMGWVSILDPSVVKSVLNAKKSAQLVSYLCLGYTDFFYSKPELEKLKWEKRKEVDKVVFEEKYLIV